MPEGRRTKKESTRRTRRLAREAEAGLGKGQRVLRRRRRQKERSPGGQGVQAPLPAAGTPAAAQGWDCQMSRLMHSLSRSDLANLYFSFHTHSQLHNLCPMHLWLSLSRIYYHYHPMATEVLDQVWIWLVFDQWQRRPQPSEETLSIQVRKGEDPFCIERPKVALMPFGGCLDVFGGSLSLVPFWTCFCILLIWSPFFNSVFVHSVLKLKPRCFGPVQWLASWSTVLCGHRHWATDQHKGPQGCNQGWFDTGTANQCFKNIVCVKVMGWSYNCSWVGPGQTIMMCSWWLHVIPGMLFVSVWPRKKVCLDQAEYMNRKSENQRTAVLKAAWHEKVLQL